MFEPTIVTWIIAGFGSIILFLLMMTQLVIIIKPKSQQAKDLLI